MIAAVVHPRGLEAARGRLARMGVAQEHERTSSHAVISRAANAPYDLVLAADTLDLEAAQRLAGTGATVALDPRGDALIAVRGSLGGRSLYTTRFDDGAWGVCSQLEPLVRASEGPFALDAGRIATFALGVQDSRGDRTPFRGIGRVPPCSAVRLGREGATTRTRPRRNLQPLEGTPDELGEELWRRLLRAVGTRIGSSKRVGVMVGGGVDSSGLCAAAIAHTRGASAAEVTAIALDFDAPGTDRPYLAALAADLGLVPVRLPPRDAGPWYASSFVLDAQPYIMPSGPLERMAYTRARELGIETLLTGQFGDEVLAGELRTLAVEAMSGSPVAAISRALRLRLPWDTTPRERVSNYIVRPILKTFVPAIVRRRLARKNAIADERYFPWAKGQMKEALRDLHVWGTTQHPPRSPSERFERFERSQLFADCADGRTQIESVTGMNRFDVYADEDILELVARVRPSVLCHDDMHRGLFRVALRGHIPEKVRTRLDKSTFERAFTEVAAAGGGFESLGDLWDVRALDALDIVDAARFRAETKPLFEHPDDTPMRIAELWCAATQTLACEAFARRYAS